MTNEFIKVGTMAVAKVGRNEIEVEIIAVEDGVYTVRNKSGKVFRARRVEPMPVPEPAASAQADTVPVTELPVGQETAIEDDTPNPASESGKPDKPIKNMTLMDAAVAALKEAGKPMNTREMVKAAIEKGYWIPTACQTPEQTLYGAIFREMKTKEQPRIVKAEEKGKFRIA